MGGYDGYADAIVDRLSARELKLILEVKRNLGSNFYEPAIRDAIYQDHFGAPSLGAAYSFARVWSWLVRGDVLIARFDVGIEPVADAELHRVRGAFVDGLNRWLPVDVSETIGGDKADSDGWIRFHREFLAMRNCGKEPAEEVAITNLTREISLEVGTQSATKTFFQLETELALARWPYGSREVFVFYAPKQLVDLTILGDE